MAAPPESSVPARPVSLTEWLRARTDAELAELLRRRPDLALPAPPDLATLAGRLAVRTSVQRAVDGLDAFLLRILEALVLCGPETSLDELAGALHGTATLEQTEHAVADLTATGLIWGDAAALNVLPTVPDSLGRYPAGLGRPAAALVAHLPDTVLAPVLRNLGLPPASQPRAGRSVAEALGDPARVAALLDELEPAERDVLTRLAAGPPLGGLRSAAAGETPAHRLVTRGLLVPIDAQSVELPREIGLALREHPMGEVGPEPPNVELTVREPAELDRAGTTAVLETIRLVDALALAWTVQPPAQLRSGGVGVRDLRRTARELGVDEPTAALIAEVAAAAGLVNATHGVEPVYLPTPDYDVWLRRDTATRWSDIALAWLGMTRQPSLVSQRGDRDRLITVLGPDAERGTIPALRQQVFEALAQLPPGSAPRQRDGLLSRLSWQAPRRASGQRPLAEAVLAEADLLGFTAAGGLTGYSRTLLAGSRAVAEQVLTSALPEPVDYFLVQPDLTVVVPGPPTPELARDLAVAADLESTGGASVYRVTEASLRRALDSGRSASELAAFLSERSRTPIPQSMQYLIDDLSRRHGALRSGAASAYLRCDDESLLTRVVTDRNVAVLQLRRLAPTVVVTTAPVARVLDVLRQAGYAPAAEAADGEVVSLSGDAPRAPSRQPVRTVRSRTTNNSSQLGEIVTRIRSGDALTELSRTVPTIAQQIPGVTSAATMGVLRDAIRDARRIMLGVAEPDGTTTRHTMLPISMGGGFVRGQETGATGLRSFPLHRITAVHVMAQADDQGDEEDE